MGCVQLSNAQRLPDKAKSCLIVLEVGDDMVPSRTTSAVLSDSGMSEPQVHDVGLAARSRGRFALRSHSQDLRPCTRPLDRRTTNSWMIAPNPNPRRLVRRRQLFSSVIITNPPSIISVCLSWPTPSEGTGLTQSSTDLSKIQLWGGRDGQCINSRLRTLCWWSVRNCIGRVLMAVPRLGGRQRLVAKLPFCLMHCHRSTSIETSLSPS